MDTLSTVSLNSVNCTLFLSCLCQKDVEFILFLNSLLALQNKEYLTAVFRRWPLSCKQFISGHFLENRMTLRCAVAKMWCRKLCAIFFWNTMYNKIYKLNEVR